MRVFTLVSVLSFDINVALITFAFVQSVCMVDPYQLKSRVKKCASF